MLEIVEGDNKTILNDDELDYNNNEVPEPEIPFGEEQEILNLAQHNLDTGYLEHGESEHDQRMLRQ